MNEPPPAEPAAPVPGLLARVPLWRWIRGLLRQWLNRLRYYEHLFMLLTAFAVGALCGLGALALHALIHLGHLLFWSDGAATPAYLSGQPWWRLLLMPALGGLAVGPLIRFLAPEARGHGVPEVIRAMAERDGLMRPRIVGVKAVASALTISSGGSAGREGPIIQIGAAIGSSIGQFLRVNARQLRILAGCGAAAGIAATFNAPIAGTLFAVEVIMGEFGILQFSPIVIAAVTATVVARGSWGNEPVFHVPHYELASPYELIPYAVLGLLCGAIAAGFTRVLARIETDFEGERRMPVWIKPMLGGLLVGAIGLWLPAVYGDGYATVNLALVNALTWWMLAALLAAKMLATSLTLGSGGSGGVFAPSLFIGAMAGGVVGHLVHLLPNVQAGSPGSYALVGMGGLVAGAMHAPITAMIMIFELTDNYTIILPLMLVCTLSTLLSSRLKRESIYTWKLVRDGVDLFRGRSLDLFRRLEVRSCLRPDPPIVAADADAAVVIERLLEGGHDALYLVTAERALAGVIYLADLKSLILRREQLRQGLLALDLANEGVAPLTPDDSLRDAMFQFGRTNLPELPVVEGEHRKLVGALRHRDVVALYNREIIRHDTTEVVAQRLQEADRAQPTPLVEGFSIMEWRPPPSLWGQTLREAALPSRFGVQAVLVKQSVDAGMAEASIAPFLPDRAYRITNRDAIIVCGRDEDLARLPR